MIKVIGAHPDGPMNRGMKLLAANEIAGLVVFGHDLSANQVMAIKMAIHRMIQNLTNLLTSEKNKKVSEKRTSVFHHPKSHFPWIFFPVTAFSSKTRFNCKVENE